MSIKNYIDSQKEYWGPEFSAIQQVKHIPAHNEIAAMGAHTMLYEIADNFRNGQFRNEILELYGVKP
jgi:hypothetical protein